MLLDLAKFAIPVYWVDRKTKQILQYVAKPNKDTGMFVPLPLVADFLRAVSFGIYGSNLISGHFEHELTLLFQGLEILRQKVNHPLFNSKTPIALITGGGPGVMEVGNKVAKSLNLLSCANIVDFRPQSGTFVNEQLQNPYVDIKMTYRLDRLVERQAEFNLDFPIFLEGGIGTDFEYSLEEVRRKVGSTASTPVLLFGQPEYWRQKITERFQCNLKTGTIAGSEWISNCFYCVQNAEQALRIYEQFFTNSLLIGKKGPIYPEGFATVKGLHYQPHSS
jgi:predicted Rossmann-fold nucleotide-binding protein